MRNFVKANILFVIRVKQYGVEEYSSMFINAVSIDNLLDSDLSIGIPPVAKIWTNQSVLQIRKKWLLILLSLPSAFEINELLL